MEIIGPWSLGITQCVSWMQAFQHRHGTGSLKYKISMWYSSPTAIRSLMKAGNELAMSYDLSSLRHLASIGEPLNPEAVIWSQRVFGKPFHDTYWQTETGSIMISNFPGMKIKPGSMGKPFPGITGVILDQERFEPIRKQVKLDLLLSDLAGQQ